MSRDSRHDLKRSYEVRWGWCHETSRWFETFEAALHEYKLHGQDPYGSALHPLWFGEPVKLSDDERELVELADCEANRRRLELSEMGEVCW